MPLKLPESIKTKLALGPVDTPSVLKPSGRPSVSLTKYLAHGSTAFIYLGEFKGKKVAVKQMFKKSFITSYAPLGHKDVGSIRLEAAQKEISMMQAAEHRNVLNMYSTFGTSLSVWIVLEYCVGDLRLLRDSLPYRCGSPPFWAIIHCIHPIITALAFLHEKDIVHCDLKEDNILINAKGEPKLADFGLAKSRKDMIDNGLEASKGTPQYMAPEQFFEKDSIEQCDEKIDVWAIGIILMSITHPKFRDEDAVNIWERYTSWKNLTITWPDVNSYFFRSVPSEEGYFSMVASALIFEAEDRTSMAKLGQHLYLKQKFPHLLTDDPYSSREYLTDRETLMEMFRAAEVPVESSEELNS